MDASQNFDILAGNQAFGSGEHPSTRLALAALEALKTMAGPTRALDVGCGSGILSLYIAYHWHIPVIASDIQAESIAVTAQNAKHNQLDSLITPVQADGFHHDQISRNAPYELITCNWLAEPLVEHAADSAPLLAEEGILILSGMLLWQKQTVQQAYEACGLTCLQHFKLKDWSCLMLQK